MVLKLDRRLPIVWRSPSSMQIGVSAPPVTLHHVSTATERIVSALSIGLTRSGLDLIRDAVGVSERHVAALLETLGPALLPATKTKDKSASIVLVGGGETAARTADLLTESGLSVRLATDASSAASEDCDFAIAIGAFAVEPELHGLWLRRDIPHLPIVLSDSEVIIGPIVEPGIGPCLYCLHRHSTDADPAWPAIAIQLYGRPSPADVALVASEVAAIVCRLTLARVAGDAAAAPVHRSIHLNVASGAVTTKEWLRHPMCGCTVPGWTNAEVQSEIEQAVDSPPVRRRHSRRWPPRRATSASSRA
jgi:bacteriocin biosynthesis cyclodehydratase domain-containing protein